ncbi:hypothetical protein H1Q63_11290 [Desmonostoc muscorum CCALA 125]|nr:hypothetical protein [Desmonostoc muscorum CCALA 125]
MGIGDWGLGTGESECGKGGGVKFSPHLPISSSPSPQPPVPSPQSPKR